MPHRITLQRRTAHAENMTHPSVIKIASPHLESEVLDYHPNQLGQVRNRFGRNHCLPIRINNGLSGIHIARTGQNIFSLDIRKIVAIRICIVIIRPIHFI